MAMITLFPAHGHGLTHSFYTQILGDWVGGTQASGQFWLTCPMSSK